MDRISIQHENSQFKKKLSETRTKFEEINEKHRALSRNHNQALSTMEHLEASLNKERKKVSELEGMVAKQNGLQRQNDDVAPILT